MARGRAHWLLVRHARLRGNLYWIAIALSIFTKLAIVGYIAALFVLAPVVAVAGIALFVLRRATKLPLALLLPVVWVASEVVLNYMSDLAFPWLPLGLALSRTPCSRRRRTCRVYEG